MWLPLYCALPFTPSLSRSSSHDSFYTAMSSGFLSRSSSMGSVYVAPNELPVIHQVGEAFRDIRYFDYDKLSRDIAKYSNIATTALAAVSLASVALAGRYIYKSFSPTKIEATLTKDTAQ